MWICPKCSEQHEDQFEFCWKCSGDEAKTAISATPLPSAMPERQLRPFRDIVVRALAGFIAGFVLTMVFLSLGNMTLTGLLPDNSLSAATLVGLAGGCIVGAAVGGFFWVLFPYAPLRNEMLVDTGVGPHQTEDGQRSE
jgi:cytochrome c biogenesis protein CcdA